MPRKLKRSAAVGPSRPSGPDRMADRVGAFDWGPTPLGPRADWPPALRAAVEVCLASPLPTLVWWGPDLTQLYNDAQVPLLGDRHPDALGRPGREVWADVWPTIAPDVREVMDRGRPLVRDRVRLDRVRDGRSVESHLTYAMSPILDADGRVGGLFQVCADQTAGVLADRERAGAERQARDDPAGTEAKLARSQAVIAGMRDGVIVADAGGNLLDVNPAALDLHGYADAPDRRTPRTIADFVTTVQLETMDGRTLPVEQWPLARLLRGEVVHDERYRMHRRDHGPDAVVHYDGTWIPDGPGRLSVALLTLHPARDAGRPPVPPTAHPPARPVDRPPVTAAAPGESQARRAARLADEAAGHVEAMLHDMDLTLGERAFCTSLGEHLVEQAIAAFVATDPVRHGYDGACIAAAVAVALLIVREPT